LDNNVDKDMKVATQVSIEDAEQIAEEFEEREERAERKQSKHKPKSFFSMFKERNAKDEE
jgi:(2Fe-2S) ferredoxin